MIQERTLAGCLLFLVLRDLWQVILGAMMVILFEKSRLKEGICQPKAVLNEVAFSNSGKNSRKSH
ncbi:hypothetical protein [Indiicoccus explosivorum]|uniref:hypothetical protein n=1 Tax=Indiicoccus explosivorum TaxID=1917864 RepID=UPI00138FCE70|nr:hypothetical protein [Indiicoccus explosivorum]